MHLRYKYRIYPTKNQIQQLISTGGSVRFLYNHFLQVNIQQYQNDKKFVWYMDMCKQLTLLKQQNTWLKDSYSQSLQQSLRDLDVALKNMKKMGAGFPRFKSKYTTPVSIRYPQKVTVNADTKHLRLPKIGDIKIKLHRKLPKFTGVTLIETARGWYASFVVEVDQTPIKDAVNNRIGVDVNSKFTALSNGELIPNPCPLAKKFKHIKNQQRKLSRKQKSSRNRIKTKNRLARIHDQVRSQRLNHIHQLSARIAKVYDLVCVETLKIEEMRRKSKLSAKAIADSGWSMLISALAYKCQLYGAYFIKINQWLPSSKTCSSCGDKKPHMDLSQREFNCNSCGYVGHRDLNAAINIRNWGTQQWNLDHAGQELPGVPVDLLMDILSNSGQHSSTDMKQEATAL